jgi:hypothetical protein
MVFWAVRFDRAESAVIAPVPPLATARVPPIVITPLVVIGEFETVSPVAPPETPTLVTVGAV